MDSLPLHSVTLIEQLDELYPPRCPKITMTEREIFLYAGKRELVESLLSRIKSGEPEDDLPKVL